MYRIILLIFFAVASDSGRNAAADIYRYVNDEGVECFTDAPTDSKAAVFMREKGVKPVAAKRKLPVHLMATGIAGKIGKNRSGTLEAGNNISLSSYGRITSVPGLRHDPIDGKLRHHNGVDVVIPYGTPIKPIAPGMVMFSGIRPGYGNTVIIEHGDGTITLYAHNSVNLLGEGAYAEIGATIALAGSTGRSTGPHLHFEAWRNGENITSSFLSDQDGKFFNAIAVNRTEDNIRRISQADGTFIYTNLPLGSR